MLRRSSRLSPKKSPFDAKQLLLAQGEFKIEPVLTPTVEPCSKEHHPQPVETYLHLERSHRKYEAYDSNSNTERHTLPIFEELGSFQHKFEPPMDPEEERYLHALNCLSARIGLIHQELLEVERQLTAQEEQ